MSLGLSSTLLARLVAVWRCCCSRARAQLIEVAFCNFGGGAINVYVLYRRHLVVFARLPPPLEVWVPCFSATINFAFWVGFLSDRGVAVGGALTSQSCVSHVGLHVERVYILLYYGAPSVSKLYKKHFFSIPRVVSIICSDFINPATDYSKSHTGYINPSLDI